MINELLESLVYKPSRTEIIQAQQNMKAIVFIDHFNIASPLLEPNCRKNKRIDYKKFKDILLHGYKEGVAIMFMGVMEPMKPKKERFMKYLEKI